MRHVLLLLALVAATMSCDRRRNAGEGAYTNRMEDAIPKIEESTGLTFKRPPKMEMRSRAQVREFLLRKFNETTPAEQLRGEEVAYKMFGLLPDTMDLRRYLLELLTEQIVGYYDPATDVLYVVEGAPEDQLGLTITHELVHALQDQYVNLDSIQKMVGSSDRQLAAQAVLEGQATFEGLKIALDGMDVASRLPGGWDAVRQQIREQQTAMPIFASAPMAIQESLLFPYLSGAEYIRRFQERRPGQSPLDLMPVSTEQVLSEAAYFGIPPDMPTTVTLPPTTEVVHEESLGAFGTRLFFYQHLRSNTEAIGVAQGWDGDRYRILRTPAGGGIVWVTVWDTATDKAEFVDALGQAVGRRYRTGPVSVRGNVRIYRGAGRVVVITPLQIDEREVVMYVDVPTGAETSVIDARRIRLGE
ncbi:MAG: hypothetical protein ACREOK_00755 [Gemmatimonadaceae bacterium]